MKTRRLHPIIGLILLPGILLTASCRTVPGTDLIPVSGTMRTACPQLTDELIEAWIQGITGLRDRDVPQDESYDCSLIPPDGNFQGDVEACEACLSVIAEEVYAAG